MVRARVEHERIGGGSGWSESVEPRAFVIFALQVVLQKTNMARRRMAIIASGAAASGLALAYRRSCCEQACPGTSLRTVTAVGDMTALAASHTRELSLAELKRLESVVLPPESFLSGFIGVPFAQLLEPSTEILTGTSAILVASDGLETEAIGLSALVRGVLVHSTADGAPLPASQGGPFRAWFPEGVATTGNGCGQPGCGGMSVKGVTELRVRSADSAAAVVLDDAGRALILQRGPTAPWMPLKWNLPGGGVDAGESAYQAAVRECEEETGLTPVSPRHLGDFEYSPCRLLSVWVAERVHGTLVVNWESCAHAWIEEAEVGTFDFVPPVVEALSAAWAARRADPCSKSAAPRPG